MENFLNSEDKINKDVAISELKEFVNKFSCDIIEADKIEDDYPQVLKAMQKGNLSFNEDSIPTYVLAVPIKSTEGNIVLSELIFRTRIKPTDLARITKGIDVSTNQIEFSLRCFAYLTGQSKTMLDKLHKFDYKVIEQLSSVFL